MTWLDPPLTAVRDVVARALAEDLGVYGDLTAGLVPPDATVKAVLAARADGVLAGRLAAAEAFAAVDPTVSVDWLLGDGDRLGAGTVIAHVSGPLASVLTTERTALNLLGHLSGIATLTRRYVDAAGEAGIRETRKTTPGLRALEKAAVRAGGGVNHRGSLSDGILVKDNHLAGLSITEAVHLAHRRWPGISCEVECDTLEQVDEALAAGADMILLDNMDPATVAAAVAQRDAFAGEAGGLAGHEARDGWRRGEGPADRREVGGAPRRQDPSRSAGRRVPLEVSGRVNLKTVGAYAAAGADLISVGSLTHSAPVLDIGLDLES